MNHVIPAAERFSRAGRLTALAHADLVHALQGYGTNLSQRHSDALYAILSQYSKLAFRELEGRFAYPLATALGKTQSIVSWCATIHRENLDRTVLITQEQIDSLLDTYNAMLEKGIPADKVGIIHRDTGRYCSTGSPRDYQFLLITHEMIKTTDDVLLFTSMAADDDFVSLFKPSERPHRDLTIWDESCIKTESRVQIGTELSEAFGALKEVSRSAFAEGASDDLRDAIEYLKVELSKVEARYQRVKTNSATKTKPFKLATASSEDIETWKGAIKAFPSLSRENKNRLRAFLDNVHEPIRVVNMGRGKKSAGLISFSLEVPAELTRLVCLDASAAVRRLMDIDNDIEIIDEYLDAKSFELMEVEQTFCAGGNTRIRNLRTNSLHVKEIVHDLTSGWLPDGACVLIATAKPVEGRKATPEQVIRKAMSKAGLNPNRMVNVQTGIRPEGGGRFETLPKYTFITWGQERATNRYRHCSHIIALGVLRRDPLELAGNIGGQHDDIGTDAITDRRYIDDVQTSEQFFRLQQLVGRGTSRQTTYGIAAPSWVKVYDQADFSPYLDRGLPHVRWTTRDHGKHVRKAGTKGTGRKAGRPKTASEQSKVAIEITEWLHRQHASEITTGDLWLALGIESVTRNHRLALDRALSAPNCPYRKASQRYLERVE
jgi:hypothetical protein